MLRRRSLALSLIAILTAALAASLLEGTPARLPGVALGSALLVHLERTVAVLAISVAVLSVLAQAARGHLPTQLTTAGLVYEAGATAAAVAQLQDQVGRLRRDVESLGDMTLEPDDGPG
jgi:hypothetical protein